MEEAALTTIDRKYRIVRRLAGGGFSDVYLVAGSEGSCALKLLKTTGNALPAQALEAFKNEFAILKNFQHPHIARILDFGYDAALQRYYFTAEYIAGTPLLIATRKAPIARITDWIVATLRALAFIHAHRCYHFDIKSDNVLVVGTAEIRLIDFGLAGIDPHGRLIGTPSYMAPEIVGRERPDHRADLYSLGVLWYYCLTGQNPFWTPSMEETLTRQLRHVPPPPSSLNAAIPAWLDHCILRLLAKNPTQRFASAAHVIQEINARGGCTYPLETEKTLLSYIPETGALIGREEECAAVARAIVQLQSGEIATDGWVIAGPTGSGKTRFLREIKYAAQLADVPVTWCEAGDAEGVASWCTELETHAVEGRGVRCFIIDQWEEGAPEEAVGRRVLGALFRAQRPTDTARWLILVGLRTDVAPTVADALASLLPHRCELTALTPEELRAYLTELTGLADPPATFVAELYRRTEGNPLFVTEVVRALIRGGGLFDIHGRWQASLFEDLGVDFSKILLPHSVDGLLVDRLMRMSIPARTVCEALAVAGRPATAPELAQWTGHPDTIEAIQQLLADDVLQRVGSLTLDFRNALLGHTVTAHLTESERARYHDRIAATAGDTEAERETALHHESHGSDAAQAIAAAITLGTRYLQQGNGHRAATYLTRAMTLQPDALPAERVRLLLQLGEAHLIAHAYRASEESLAAVETALAEVPLTPEVSQWRIETLLRLIGLACKMEAFQRAAHLLDAADGMVMELPDGAMYRLQISNFRGAIHFAQGRREAARDLFRATRDAARRLPIGERARVTNNDLGMALLRCGDLAQAERVLQEDLGQAEQLGDDLLIARAHYNLAEAHIVARAYLDATAAYERCVEVCRRSNNTELLLRAYNGLGNVRQLLKDLDGSRQYYERGLALHERVGDLRGGAAIAINLAIVEHARAADRAAVDLLLPSLRLLEQLPEKTAADWVALARGHLECAEIEWKEGRVPEATTRIGKILAMAQTEEPVQAYRFWGTLLLAEILRADGDRTAYTACIAGMEPLIRTAEEREHWDRFMAADAAGVIVPATGGPLSAGGTAGAKRAPLAELAAPGSESETPTPGAPEALIRTPEALIREPWSISGSQWLRPLAELAAPGAPVALIREESYRRILEVNRALNAEHDLGAVLNMVLHYALELAQAESGAILLTDDHGALQIACQRNYTADAEALQFSRALARRVLQENQRIITDDALADPRFTAERSIADYRLRSILCLPIRSQQRIVGALYLNHRYRTGAFRQTDLPLLDAFADLAGIAIANAQLIEALQHREVSLHAELSQTAARLKEYEERIQAQGTGELRCNFGPMLGRGHAMQQIFRLGEKIADTDLGVLILGESGTGKELIAQALHRNHQRRHEGRFVAINCGAIPATLMESELFGYKAGAFTGATRDRRGWLAEADGGTLFLDEIAELAVSLQVTLLRVLQEREFTRLGDTRPTPCDMRVIAASNRDVAQLVRDGTFREDLYYRLCQVTITLPPLRERAEDIPDLVRAFLREAAPQRPLTVSAGVMRHLLEHPWPGNVRELQNVIQVATALCEGDQIDETAVPAHLVRPAPAGARPRASVTVAGAGPTATIALDEQNIFDATLSLREYEMCIIAKAFQVNAYRARPTAQELGIALATLYKRLREGNLLDRTQPIYATPFVYQRGRTLRSYRLPIFRAAYECAHHRPYLAVAALKISQGYFHKVMRNSQ